MKKKNIVDIVIDGISAIFLPLANILSAAGILKGILAILTATSVLTAESESYLILNAVADSLFYFLPVLLAYTAARKFGSDPFACVVIAGILLYPTLTEAMGEGRTLHLFGLPVRAATYQSSVLPIILAAVMLAFMERLWKRVLPEVIQGFMIPMLDVAIVGVITLFLFGPFGAVVGEVLAGGYEWLYALSPILAGALFGAAIQPMVIFGFQWGLILVAMNNIAVTGRDTVLALIAPAVFAQVGAALAVMIKSRDKAFRSVCASAALSAAFGITEPAMFGVNLPRKKPLVAVAVGGGIGGILAGLSGAQAMAFVFPGLASLPVFWGEGFLLYLVSCLVGFAAAFALTLVMRFEVDIQTGEKLQA